MQETKAVNLRSEGYDANCICQTLRILCKHNMRICTCTYCRIKAAPRQTSAYNRTTAAQLTAIMNLAKAKQRSLPANISTWSIEFASKYIKFLYSLPFPREYLPRLEQFDKDHATGADAFYAKTTRYGEYYWNDGMTKPVTQAIVDGDNADLVAGVIKEVPND
mgnify:CR=1 FL=1